MGSPNVDVVVQSFISQMRRDKDMRDATILVGSGTVTAACTPKTIAFRVAIAYRDGYGAVIEVVCSFEGSDSVVRSQTDFMGGEWNAIRARHQAKPLLERCVRSLLPLREQDAELTYYVDSWKNQ
jgi:hypothetical protein